jgi:hypothetical protein
MPNLTVIVLKKKPTKPKCQSDIRLISNLLSDHYYKIQQLIISQGKVYMATLEEVKQAVVDLKTTVTGEALEVANEMGALKALVASLQGTLNNGATVTAEDLDEVLASIVGVQSLVEGIIVTAE